MISGKAVSFAAGQSASVTGTFVLIKENTKAGTSYKIYPGAKSDNSGIIRNVPNQFMTITFTS